MRSLRSVDGLWRECENDHVPASQAFGASLMQDHVLELECGAEAS